MRRRLRRKVEKQRVGEDWWKFILAEERAERALQRLGRQFARATLQSKAFCAALGALKGLEGLDDHEEEVGKEVGR